MKERVNNCIVRHLDDMGRNSLLLFLSVFYLVIGIVIVGEYETFPVLEMKIFKDLMAWYQIVAGVVSILSFIFILSRFSNLLRALAYWMIAAVGFSGGVIFAYLTDISLSLISFFTAALVMISLKISYKKYVAMKRG